MNLYKSFLICQSLQICEAVVGRSETISDRLFSCSSSIGLSHQMDRWCGGVRDRVLGINPIHGSDLRLSIVLKRIRRTRLIQLYTVIIVITSVLFKQTTVSHSNDQQETSQCKMLYKNVRYHLSLCISIYLCLCIGICICL